MSKIVVFLKAEQGDLFDKPVNVKAGVRGGKAVAAYTRVQKVAAPKPVVGHNRMHAHEAALKVGQSLQAKGLSREQVMAHPEYQRAKAHQKAVNDLWSQGREAFLASAKTPAERGSRQKALDRETSLGGGRGETLGNGIDRHIEGGHTVALTDKGPALVDASMKGYGQKELGAVGMAYASHMATHINGGKAPGRNFHVVAHYEDDRQSEESHISASNHAEAAVAAEKRHPEAAVRTIQEVAAPPATLTGDDAAKAARDEADLAYAKHGYQGQPDPDAAAMQRYGQGVRAEEARALKSPEHKAMVAQSEAEVAKMRADRAEEDRVRDTDSHKRMVQAGEEWAKNRKQIMPKVEAQHIMHLLNQENGQAALNGLAVKHGVATAQSDANTVRIRIRRLADDALRQHAAEHARAEEAKPKMVVFPKASRSIKPKEPSAMTASEINKTLDRHDAESSKITTAMIEAGRGHELPTETLKLSDPLAMRMRDNFEKRSALRQEVERRYGPGAPSRLPLRR